VHLQPVAWQDGWPITGRDIDNDGIGEPVLEWQKPDVEATYPVTVPQTTDEFESGVLGLQWQWQANPVKDRYSLTDAPGALRLFAVRNPTQAGNLWRTPNLLLQKFPAPAFTAVTRVSFKPDLEGEKAGLVIMGKEWGYLALAKTSADIELGMFTGTYFQGYDKTEKIEAVALAQDGCYMQVQVDGEAMCRFSYSLDGKTFHKIGKQFKALPGTWIGAKVGLFAVNPNISESTGYADFDWFRLE
jgi:beta-xylosidase